MAVEMNNQANDVVIDLCELPEGCIANALSLTCPRDACRLSLVGSAFRSAAQSDAVWERFLPPDYRDILRRSPDGIHLLRSPLSKKQLYLHLCDNPILIDGGTKSFSLEKSSGKKCYMLAASDLKIVWGDTPTYWQWTPHAESRFSVVAELLQVCWLEIRGKIRTSMLSPDTTYAAYLVVRADNGSFGLDFHPAEASVGISGEEGQKKEVHLDPDGARRQQIRPRRRRGIFFHRQAALVSNAQYAQQRGDNWLEIELGEIFIGGGQDAELEMSLMEVMGGNWKGGLIVQGIEIRPKVGH